MTASLASSTTATPRERSELLAVSVATLVPSAVLPLDLYLKPAGERRPVLYRGRNYPVTAEDIQRLLASGTRSLYIAKDEYHGYQEYLRENLDPLVTDERLPPEQRVQFLVEAARDTVLEAFTRGDTNDRVRVSTEFASRIVGLLANRTVLFPNVFRIMNHDWQTFTHVTNVAIYCVMLAKRLGIGDEEALEEIATGALLHDVGKRFVPASILLKAGPLTPEERRLIERHPQTGFEELAGRDDLTWAQLMMVYQHHERLDGRGYPVRLQGGEIHERARLCAVADVFEAISSDRPYRHAMPLVEALDVLERQAGRGLDKEMVACWNSVMIDSM